MRDMRKLLLLVLLFSSCTVVEDEEVFSDFVEELLELGVSQEVFTCQVSTVEFVSAAAINVKFDVSLLGVTKSYVVEQPYIEQNGLITVGDSLIYINDFSAKGNKATFDFYYGENLGYFCLDLFSAIPMHPHDAFSAEADRVLSGKNVGKWKVKKRITKASNEIPRPSKK